MSSNDRSLSESMVQSFQRLSVAASELNRASDEIGKSVNLLDSLLKDLNLGVAVWVSVTKKNFENDSYRLVSLGYDKLDTGKWGTAIRLRIGGDSMDLDDVTEWPFNDAPRELRVESLEKIPSLIQEMAVKADEVRVQIEDKLRATNASLEAIQASIARPSRELVKSSAPRPIGTRTTPPPTLPNRGGKQ